MEGEGSVRGGGGWSYGHAFLNKRQTTVFDSGFFLKLLEDRSLSSFAILLS